VQPKASVKLATKAKQVTYMNIYIYIYEYCTRTQNSDSSYILAYLFVLGSARTGLIFTRSQEGTQPGGLTQIGQTKQGNQYRVQSRWVLSGGAEQGGRDLPLGSARGDW